MTGMEDTMLARRLQLYEYLDVSRNMRLYINMRFAQLTLFVAITAALLKPLLQETPMSQHLCIILKIGGVIATIAFLIMEERAADFFHYFKNKAMAIEKVLGFSQYRDRPQRRFISATNAVRAIFASLITFWCLWLLYPSCFAK